MWLWLFCLVEKGWPGPWPEQEAPVYPHLVPFWVTGLMQSRGCPRKKAGGALQVLEVKTSLALGKKAISTVTGNRASLCLELWVQKTVPHQALQSMALCALQLPMLRFGQCLVKSTGRRDSVPLLVKSGHGYDGGRLKAWAAPDARSRE